MSRLPGRAAAPPPDPDAATAHVVLGEAQQKRMERHTAEEERVLLNGEAISRKERAKSSVSISRRHLDASKGVAMDQEETQRLYGELKERILAWKEGRPAQLSQSLLRDSALDVEDAAARSARGVPPPGEKGGKKPEESASYKTAVSSWLWRVLWQRICLQFVQARARVWKSREMSKPADSADAVNRIIEANKEMIEAEEVSWKHMEAELLALLEEFKDTRMATAMNQERQTKQVRLAKQVRQAKQKMEDIEERILTLLQYNHTLEKAVRQREEMDIVRITLEALRSLQDGSAEILEESVVPLPETSVTVAHAAQAGREKRAVSADVVHRCVEATTMMLNAEELSIDHVEAEIQTLLNDFRHAKEKQEKSPQFVKRYAVELRTAKERQEDAVGRIMRLSEINQVVEQSIRQRQEVDIVRMNEKVLENLRVEHGYNLEDSAARLSGPDTPAAHVATQPEREMPTVSSDVNVCLLANKNLIKEEELRLKRIESEYLALVKELSDIRNAQALNQPKSRVLVVQIRAAKQKMENSRKRIAMLSQYNQTMEQITQPIRAATKVAAVR